MHVRKCELTNEMHRFAIYGLYQKKKTKYSASNIPERYENVLYFFGLAGISCEFYGWNAFYVVIARIDVIVDRHISCAIQINLTLKNE